MNYSKIEEGKLVRKGTEYGYVIEADAKDKIRFRIISEKPIIEKVRTRYDPEIQLYGDKNASMEVSLGYDMKEINKIIKYAKYFILGMPLVSIFTAGVFILIDKIPKSSVPSTGKIAILVLSFVFIGVSLWLYFRLSMRILASYFQAKDTKNMLVKEGALKKLTA